MGPVPDEDWASHRLSSMGKPTSEYGSQADHLRRIVGDVRGERPTLEGQLADYRDRHREYDKLRQATVAQATPAGSDPSGVRRIC